jgi:hypothetical protein
MSFVNAVPEMVSDAATNLASIGSTISAANAAAAAPTTGVLAAGADEVSAGIARVFGGYAQQYQALTAQTGLFHDQFVQALNTGAGAYAATEAANSSAAAINMPALLKNLLAAADQKAMQIESEIAVGLQLAANNYSALLNTTQAIAKAEERAILAAAGRLVG